VDATRSDIRHSEPSGQDLHNSGRVKVFKQAPSPALRPFIKWYMVVEFPSHHRDAHLPSLDPVAAFSLRGECRLSGTGHVPMAAFTGPRETLRTHEHCDGHAVFLTTFTPAGAAAFVQPPMEEFAGITTSIADIFVHPKEFDEFHEQLFEADNHRTRVALMESFLLKRIRNSTPDPLVSAAVNWLEKTAGAKRIDDLTKYIGLSQSALERRFRRIVGISPKKYASIVRLQRAVQMRANVTDLTAVAHAAGYFDQSHFIKDFKRAIGTTPDAFFRRSPVI
jgi:AraC-like DNA-binding protein